MIEQNPDFIAQLRYKTTEDGGRKIPAFSGYRPQIKFPFSEIVTSGQQTFLDKEIVYPGENVKASIRIISIEFFENSLTEGMQFEFREGSNIIGTGVLVEIINKRLKKI